MNKKYIAFSLIAVFFLSCKHIAKQKDKKLILKSNDGLIKAEQINLEDPYETKIDKLLKSAYINYKNNNFTKAIINYETAKIFNISLDFWHSHALAYCYLTVGNYKKSIDLLEKLIEDKPEIADSFVLLGFNFMRTGKIDLAIDNFNRALALETHSPRTYYYLGLAKKMKNSRYKLTEMISKAKREYIKILSKNPNDFETLLDFSYLFATSGDILSARNYLEKAKSALNISPEIEEITYQQSLAPYQNPIWSFFYLNLIEGIILNKEKEPLKSNQSFLIALQNPPGGSKLDIAEIYYYISQNFTALKNTSASSTAIKLAKELDPMVTSRLK